MRRKVKIFHRVLPLIGVFLCLSGCNGTGKEEKVPVTEYKVSEEELSYAMPKAGEAAVSWKSKTEPETKSKGKISVATVGSPNIEILQQAGKLLAQKGYQLEIELCEDYLEPNRLVAQGSVDCNYYQHASFLERYNIEYGTELQEMAKIHYEPLAIYGNKIENLQQVEKGMKVALPENATALAQSLMLLQEEGLLTLMSDADMTAVMEDILENPLELEFVLMPEEEIVQKMSEVDLGIYHMGHMLKEGRQTKEGLLAMEQKESMAAKNLAQGIVVYEYPNEKASLLIDILMGEEMQQYMESRYHGSLYLMENGME